MEKVFIAGGFGFIGKNLIEYLYDKYEIVVIDKYVDNDFIEIYKKLNYYKYDFFEQNNIKDIIEKENPEYIINLISIVSAERNMSIFNEMIQVNVDILLKLYEASKELKHLKLFLQFGSGEEYGNIKSPFSETDREYPNSPYSLSKQITTNTAIMLHKNYNFPTCVIRPGNLFGKYQNETKFIPYILNKLIKNEKIETTLGEQKRDFIYAADFTERLNLILENYNKFIGEIINLSSGESISLREVILLCKEYINSKSEIEFGKINYRENEIMDFKLDISKFNKIANIKYKENYKDGFYKYIKILEY